MSFSTDSAINPNVKTRAEWLALTESHSTLGGGGGYPPRGWWGCQARHAANARWRT